MTLHRMRWDLAYPPVMRASCECGGWVDKVGGRYVPGNADELRARFRLHLVDVGVEREVTLRQALRDDDARYDAHSGIGADWGAVR